jgi:NADPH:quinone reductase
MTVRAVVLREFGDPSAGGIGVEERPDPQGGPDGEVLIDLLAADLQPLDRQIARGYLPGSGPLPMIAGVSAVGRTTGSGRTVVVLGEITGRGITRDGLLTDRFAAEATQLAPVPPQLDPRAVAAGAVLGMHARHTLFEVAGARPGHRVLVLGANGGFGHAVVATAHSEGLEVIAAARRPSEVDAPRGVPVLDLNDLDGLAAAVKDLTGGHGVDVIVDPLGGEVTYAAVRAGARACRHVLLGHTAGMTASVPVPAMMLNEHRLLGVNGFLIPVSEQHYYLKQALADMATGHHIPRIGAVVDLGEAAGAYAGADAQDGRTIIVGAALGDASAAVEHTPRAAAPAPGRHDHDHDHGDDHGHAHDGHTHGDHSHGDHSH